MDAETREALEAVRRFVDGFTSGMKQPDPTPYPTPQQVRSDLARIEQTLRDLSEQRDEWKERAVLTGSEAAALAERVERAKRELVEWRTSIATEALEARADAAEAEAARLREALRDSDALIRFLRPDLSHTRPRADEVVEANRAALSLPTDGEAT